MNFSIEEVCLIARFYFIFIFTASNNQTVHSKNMKLKVYVLSKSVCKWRETFTPCELYFCMIWHTRQNSIFPNNLENCKLQNKAQYNIQYMIMSKGWISPQ